MESSTRQQAQTTNRAQAAEQTREKAADVATQAREKAQGLAGQARERARQEVDRRSTETGERIGGAASDLRSVGEELRNRGKDGPARIAEQAADRVDRASSYLRDADSDRLLGDVEDFGRRQPWAVLAGAVLAGFAAARFLKASSRERYSKREATRFRSYRDGMVPDEPRLPAGHTAAEVVGTR
jgi:hypothetical protein